MKTSTMLRKIVHAMHHGRPSITEDPTWDRAVEYAEQLLRLAVEDELSASTMEALLVKPATILSISRSDCPPRYHLSFQQWLPSGAYHSIEHRNNDLVAGLRSLADSVQ